MAKLIEFHVPDKFRSPSSGTPAERRGQLIEFRPRNVNESNTNADQRPSALAKQAGSAVEVPFRWP